MPKKSKEEEEPQEEPKEEEKPIIKIVEKPKKRQRTIISRGIDRASIKEAILKSRKPK